MKAASGGGLRDFSFLRLLVCESFPRDLSEYSRRKIIKFDLHSNVEFALCSIVAGYCSWRFHAFC